jgi:hypothetical protein
MSYTFQSVTAEIKIKTVKRYLAGEKVKTLAIELLEKNILLKHDRVIKVSCKQSKYQYVYSDAVEIIYR